ncbi:MAG: PilZ domain-containing protein, partial [Desulfovibrio sp.]|nr:PilZ domain-containing protein [Desulfovibrio sp.]
KAELARLLRRVTALPAASQPAALPDVATFAPDASGIIQVQCPGCGSRKALKAADVATVKQPARMKCKQCNTAFSCRFSLEAPTGAGARARAAPAPRSLPEAQAIPTFYADLAGNVTLVCPSCHAANTVASETLRGVEQPARIRCGSCDTAFPCRLVLGPPAAAPRGSIASAPPKASTAAATALAAKAAPPGIHDPEDTGDPALTMQADALGRFAKPPIQHQEPSDTTAESPSGEFHTRSDEELSKTMSPERLQALFADHTEEAMALAAVSLKGDALGRYFKAPHDAELFVEDMTATLEEDSSPSQEPLEPLVPAIVADVLPVMPFETVPAPEGEDPPTYYVDESRQVMVICPKCERGRNLDFSSHAEVGPVIRTWCKCGNAYHCRLEFRRNYRKKVNFPGSFYVPANNLQGEMTVTDISLGGVGFTLPAPYGLLPDTIIDLHFTLDDLKKTPIQRRVRVRTVKGLSVGSEFLEQRGRDKDLGYYLMP